MLMVVANPISVNAQSLTRADRLIALDVTYRSQGWEVWLKASGVNCTAVVDARQPEEETVVSSTGETRVVVSGIQLNGTCNVPFPAIVTTDHPSYITTNADTRQYQPDLRNPSVLYTNVDSKGPVTIWIDGSNWSQLTPVGQATVAPAATATQPAIVANPTQPAVVNPVTVKTPWWVLFGVLYCLVPLLIVGLIVALIIWLVRRNANNNQTAAAAPVTAPVAAPVAVAPVAAPAVIVTNYTAAQLKAAVPTLTDQQAAALHKAFPTKDGLKNASIAEIRSAGKMGETKAKLVKNASL